MVKNYRVSFWLSDLLILTYVLAGCTDLFISPEPGRNLINNGSFETDHRPTLQGWQAGNPQLATLVNEAPPDGGSWSLQLTSDWAPTTGYAYTPIMNVQSGDIVMLSAYVRANGRLGGAGSIALAVGPQFPGTHMKKTWSADTLWNRISVIDTLALEPGDTVWVILSSPITELVPFQDLFDLVKLEKFSK